MRNTFLIKDRFLRKVLLVVFVAAIVGIIAGSYVIYPIFTKQVVKNTENEAVMTAKHLSNMLFSGEKYVERVNEQQLSFIKLSSEDFNFFKIKIFSKTGKVIYSTDQAEIGQVNERKYFFEEVAKGNIFTKIVNQDSKSMEGELIEVDVVETYVPVLRDGEFVGALELYYDVSNKLEKLRSTLITSNFMLLSLIAAYLIVILIILVELDRAITERKEINQELEDSNVSLAGSKDLIEIKSKNLQEAFNKISQLTKQVSTTQDINIRYHNPNLVKCYEIKNCQQLDCPCHERMPMRCWQEAGTYCGGKVQGTYAQKYIDCMDCEVYNMAAPDHVEMIGEHFNNMMHILEMKHNELEKAICDLKATQAQLIQSEKMASMGTLAGGIAHEFNNILGAIIGYADLAKEEMPEGGVAREDLEQVLAAGNRAKDLVKQILAFSRQDEHQFMPVKMYFIIEEAIKFLKTSIPSSIKISKNICKDCLPVMADPTQIHQLLMNLCTNAVHAMNEKGVLEITLTEVDLAEENQTIMIGTSSDTCAKLTVSDTGVGMDQATQRRIFDPFFTTKGIGQGTGMGLSVVHGIVENHGGKITVESELGRGTSFYVYLPVTTQDIEPYEESVEDAPVGSESILYVDDEMVLAHMGKQILERLGYEVSARTSSVEAFEAFRNQPERFDLIITDQTMPNISGVELVEKVRKIRSDIPIILCTGFSSVVNEEQAESIGVRAFVMKPVEKLVLARTVRMVLDEDAQMKSKDEDLE